MIARLRCFLRESIKRINSSFSRAFSLDQTWVGERKGKEGAGSEGQRFWNVMRFLWKEPRDSTIFHDAAIDLSTARFIHEPGDKR